MSCLAIGPVAGVIMLGANLLARLGPLGDMGSTHWVPIGATLITVLVGIVTFSAAKPGLRGTLDAPLCRGIAWASFLMLIPTVALIGWTGYQVFHSTVDASAFYLYSLIFTLMPVIMAMISGFYFANLSRVLRSQRHAP